MKLPYSFSILVLVSLIAAGCSTQSSPTATSVPTPSGDVIATAVAGTLEASSAKTATVAAKAQLTAQAITPSPVPPTPTAANTLAPTAAPTETPTQAPPASSGLPQSFTVAFVGAGNNVWIWRDGQPKPLTSSGDVAEVAVSDDGQWVAFTRSTDFIHYSLWVIGVDGQEERPLVDIAGFSAMPAAPGAVSVVPVMFNWAPGSHTVAFTTRPLFEGPGVMLNDDLWLVNADTLERKELLPAEKGGKFYYSPDGKQIALVKRDSIGLINADGSNLREAVLKFSVVSTYSEYFYYPAPAWLPDSSGLRVVIPPKAALEHPEEPSNIWEMPVDGGAPKLVGSVNATPPLSFPQLSPDGSKVAYFKQVGKEADNRSELHIANADGSDDTAYVTEVAVAFIAWSPDAQHFFFTVGSTDQAFIGSLGAQPQPMSSVTRTIEVRWVDNARFLFVSRGSDGVELRQGDLTGASQVLASFQTEEGRPLLYDFSR